MPSPIGHCREQVTVLLPNAITNEHDGVDRSSHACARGLEREPHQTMGITWGAHLISGKHFYYSARYQSDASIALGPILKMYIPGQIRIYNALSSDGYSTGNAPPSGNNSY